jgi:hypothetical protein
MLVFRLRRWALRLTVAVSVFIGIALTWPFAPRAFVGLSTGELLLMTGLLVLPLMTAWSVWADRRRVLAERMS